MMRKLGYIVLGLSASLALGCEQTQECEQLEKLVGEYEKATATMRARAGLHAQAQERLGVVKGEAEALLEKLGLDKTEEEMTAVLVDRAEALGARVEKGSREIPIGVGTGDGATERQTIWNFVLDAKDTADAIEQSRKLAGAPPLFRYVALLGGEDGWRFRLGKTAVEKVDLSKIGAAPAPELRSPDSIDSELGFCGASGLRSKIEALSEEMKALEEKAAETTVAMPKAASWEGLRRRVLQTQAEEGEARAFLDELLTAAVRANVPVKAAGVESAVVILELRGGPKERKRFLSKLSPKMLEALRPADTERPGLIRYMRMIPAADVRRRRGPPDVHMQPGAGHP